MKSIYTLVPDIQELVTRKNGWFSGEVAKEFSHAVESRVQKQFEASEKAPSLRLSQMGPRCPCALWHSINSPGEAELLPPWAEVKYCFGHLVEALAIAFARGAGHRVEGEGDECDVLGIKGHRDCIIDGCLVDVKSAASPSFKEFKQGRFKEGYAAGYLDQLDGYLVGSALDPKLIVKDKGYLLIIDKQLGHMHLHEHRIRIEQIKERVRLYKEIVRREHPPACECVTRADGSSGNIVLAYPSNYEAYKYCCRPSIRTFLFADGPRYFTKVVREPAGHVQEIDRYGKAIYRI